jgi:exonuclease SbcC
MHLHSMTMQALGPFAGLHTIDFAELGASGLFLLEGPTGAGKSTIIDAIVFALYGKVASEEASEERLRSAHAGPDVETFVDLVLEAGSGVYRVRRTPRYERPKQRGSGTTTQQPSVNLWRLSSPDDVHGGELLASRLDDAGGQLQRIIGLDRSQFVQTIVLPQGEFARFLRTNPEDRRGLLQKVFGTAVYEQLQKRLEAMRAEVGRSLEDARQGVSRAGAGFMGAAGLDGDEVDGLDVDVRAGAQADDLLTRARARVAELRRTADETAEAAASASRVRASARADLDRARRVAAALERRASLRTELARLVGQETEHATRIARRGAAHRAEAVLALVRGEEAAMSAEALAAERWATVRAAGPTDLQAIVDAFTEPEVQRKALVVERDRCTAAHATLRRLVEVEGGLRARHGQIAAGLSARAGKATERDRLVAERRARPELRRTLTDELSRTRVLAGSVAGLVERQAAVRDQLAAARDVERLTVQVLSAESAVVAAAAAAQRGVVQAAQMQQARIAGMAGELAMRLAPGEPCAVCGGLEHPHPAARVGGVTAEDVESAELDRASAADRLAQATDLVAALRIELEGRAATAAGHDVARAQAALDAVVTELRDARAAAVRETELTEGLTRFDTVSEQLDAQITALTAQLASEDARIAGLRAQVRHDEAELAAAREGAASVRERAAELERRSVEVTAWIDALARLEDARTQQAVRVRECAAACAEHGFADASAVRASALPAPDLAALDAAVTAYEAALARVTDGLAEPEIAELAEDEAVDLVGAQVRCAEAEGGATVAAGVAASAAQRSTSAAAALGELERSVAALGGVEREAGPVVRMANLAAAAGGDNAERLTLATYVLARRFEDVVAAANSRLLTMSDGRYELLHSTSREDVGSRRKGLSLTVVDHVTDTARDPRTLSGGETFYVSLCLALGLADVVTAEAGGIDLGTLFVDEGFGSLDPQTLEVVLTELGRLRDGGRVVGVVSHVEALKQSIAERIEVRRLPDGSSTLAVCA